MAPNMNQMMKQARKMQADLAKAQEESVLLEAEATVGGGAVTAVAKGDTTIKSIKIDPDAVDVDDIEMLEDLVLAAVNEALRDVQDQVSDKMSEITGGLNIPGL
ncbi:MAG: YbaB/EbfC family nucleoid-associated protein [Coriobacteriales bacterium]|jgi:DNA-binding YbaB/EbfC family protein|nr:YbaB/EbfC family nucleoid-associated protein [Coriobacteriales bacterium]